MRLSSQNNEPTESIPLKIVVEYELITTVLGSWRVIYRNYFLINLIFWWAFELMRYQFVNRVPGRVIHLAYSSAGFLFSGMRCTHS